MIVDLYVDANSPDNTAHALASWLRDDVPLRTASIQLCGQSPSPQDMGVAGDLVRIVLEPGGAVVALASAVGGWLVSRSGRIRLHLRHGDTEIDIEVPKVRDADKIAELIRRELGQP